MKDRKVKEQLMGRKVIKKVRGGKEMNNKGKDGENDEGRESQEGKCKGENL